MATAKTASKITVQTVDIMDSKSLRLIKRARKQMRRLRKRAIKVENTTTLIHAERLIEMFDGIIKEQKTARDAATDGK